MLSACTASQAFIIEQRTCMGLSHHLVGSTQISEVSHLTRIFRSSTPDRADITALLQCVRNDKTNSFTEDQTLSLIETASVRLSSSVGIDGAIVLQGDLHGGQKSQTHLYTFNYYNEEHWSCWGGVATNRQKFNKMSKTWLQWGLHFPSGPTFRIGLATILVATEMNVAATHARVQDAS